ncbi:MAG: M1 family metallopeptidase [Anaerolineae bacterium]
MPETIRRLPLAFRLLPLTLCFLLCAACLPSPPASTPSPISIPTSAPPSYTPTPIPTSLPGILPIPSDHAQALRPEFLTDLDLLPDATRYEVELAITPDMTTITGHERVGHFNTGDTPLKDLYLCLFPNTPGYGGEMTATNILLDGRPVMPVIELDGSALRLPLDPPLEPGAGLDLRLAFTLTVPTEVGQGDVLSLPKGYRQLGYYDGVLALANAYPFIPVYDDEGWNVELAPTYGDAVYSETSFYVVHITAPAEMRLITSGTCATPDLNPDGSTTWTCVTGPMRDFNAVLGPDYQVESHVVEGVTVNSVFYPQHHQGGENALDWATEAVRLFSTRFGPYPFTELDVVETPTCAGGIEYPGLVVINSSYYETLSERMEWVVVHEVGHQWWYSLVGNDQVDEPWLDEALVQYSTLLYYEDRYGAELAAELLEQVFRRPYEELVASGRDAPAGLPVAAYSEEDYGPVVYQKGPLYFHALRQEVGDESFWAILQAYFARNRYGVATPEDWLATVEAVTGDEQRALYEQWIEGRWERQRSNKQSSGPLAPDRCPQSPHTTPQRIRLFGRLLRLTLALAWHNRDAL